MSILRLPCVWLLICSIVTGLVNCAPIQISSQADTRVPLTASLSSSPLHSTQQRPPFIQNVSPPESGILPLSLYRADKTQEYLEETGIYADGEFGSPEAGYKSNICVNLDVAPVVQIGDDFSHPDLVIERIVMEVNGLRLLDLTENSYEPTLTTVIDESKQVVTTKYSGPFIFCWRAKLDVGTHNVTFRFRQNSGVMREYFWQFTIIPG